MRDALEESQGERKRFVQEQTLRLQSRYQTLQSSLDTAYEDRLRDVIDEAMFKRKGSQWREEMQDIEIELENLREATETYHDEGLRLLELAQVAHGQYLAANPEKQAKILKCVGSNFVFDGVNVTATYKKPFDILAERPSNENWLLERYPYRTLGKALKITSIGLNGKESVSYLKPPALLIFPELSNSFHKNKLQYLFHPN